MRRDATLWRHWDARATLGGLAALDALGTLSTHDSIMYHAWLDLRHESHMPSLQPVSQKDLVSALHHITARFCVPFANMVLQWMGAKGDVFVWRDPYESDESIESDAPRETQAPKSQESREVELLRAQLSGAAVAPKPTRVLLKRRQ